MFNTFNDPLIQKRTHYRELGDGNSFIFMSGVMAGDTHYQLRGVVVAWPSVPTTGMVTIYPTRDIPITQAMQDRFDTMVYPPELMESSEEDQNEIIGLARRQIILEESITSADTIFWEKIEGDFDGPEGALFFPPSTISAASTHMN